MSHVMDLELFGTDEPSLLGPDRLKWSFLLNDDLEQFPVPEQSRPLRSAASDDLDAILFEDELRSAEINGGVVGYEPWLSQRSDSTAGGTDYQLLTPDDTQDPLNHRSPSTSCFGMIYRLNVKLIGNMSEALSALVQTRSACPNHWVLEVRSEVKNEDSSERPNLLVSIEPQGLSIAQLNVHASETLTELLRRGVKLEALAHKNTINSAMMTSLKASDATTTLNLNVYGDTADAQFVGQHLSANKLWLQRPVWCQPNTNYDNPHTIKLESFIDTSDVIPKLEPESTSSSITSLEDFTDGIYTSLIRDSALTGLAGDSRLRTALQPHQEKALEFMIQRESGEIPDAFRLWHKTSSDSNMSFEHEITHRKSTLLPDEGGGGIVADEMGMGKTYSTLALIVRTISDAHKWAAEPATRSIDEIPFNMSLARATLIVVPSRLLLATWQDELALRVEMPLKVYTYHGVERTKGKATLLDQDIILTTYHTLLADIRIRGAPLSQIWWYRLVLDEAHFIRRPTSHLHRVVASLDAKYRWCLTGTPIQNSLDDVGALIAFLRISPFDRIGWFRKYISVLYQQGGSRRASAEANLTKLLDAVSLRRTKEHLHLLPITEEVRTVIFSDAERAQYKTTKRDLNSALDQAVYNSAFSRRFGLLQAQLQLRLLCNHGTYQNPFDLQKNTLRQLEGVHSMSKVGDDTEEAVCSVCARPTTKRLMSQLLMLPRECTHVLCVSCEGENDGACPVCKNQAHPSGQVRGMSELRRFRREQLRTTGHSSKIEALISDLRRCMDAEKCLVFSTWTTTLDLIAFCLQAAQIRFERIDGEHTFEHRRRVLLQFENDPALRIIIMTTGVGAFGLNIIAASRVFLYEPQWNPSVEAQAIGRTQRIGQDKAVVVTRYVVQDSVERDMRNVQHRKRKLARNVEMGN